jgi:RNA polymerase sigma factor (sigma-70 family)
MGTSQAYAYEVQPTDGAPHVFVRVQRERPGRIGSHATRLLNSGKGAASPDKGTEWAVIQQAIGGDAAAQQSLFTRHATRFYRAAFAVLRNKEDAEDAVQDGLCKAYTNLRSFEGRSSFSTWLTRIVINSALMSRRRKNAHPESSLDEILDSDAGPLLHGVVDAQPDPERFCAAIEIDALVKAQVRQLPPLLRTTLRLRATNQLSMKETSQVLSIPVSAVKSRISRARKKLAQGLQRALEPSASTRRAA